MKGGNSKDSWRDQTEVVSHSLQHISEIKLVEWKYILTFITNQIQVMKITSTLASIASLVWEAKTVQQAKDTLTEHLRGTNVKDRDKMIQDIEQLKTLEQVHRYTANALLKYEGLGTSL